MISRSEEDTVEAGRQLAASLRPGDVVLLSGPLGAGKTAFVRGLAQGLGANPADVTSPTFTLIQEYRGAACALYHVDLYRLGPHEVDDLGLDELMSGDAIVAVEWPERLPRSIRGAIGVTLAITGESERTLEFIQPDSSALPS